MWQRIFLAWFYLLPFVYGSPSAELLKVRWFFAGTVVLACWWIGQIWKGVKLDRSDGLYFVWLLLLCIASLSGGSPEISLFGAGYRFQGILFFVAFWLVGKTLQQFPHSSFIREGMKVTIILEAAIILLQYYFGRYVPFQTRLLGFPIGTFGEPHLAGAYLAAGVGIFTAHGLRGSMRIARWGSLLFILWALLTLSSLWSLLAFAFFLGHSLILKTKSSYVAIWIYILCAIAVPFVGGFFVVTGQEGNIENRRTLWNIAAHAIQSKPILGYGAESIDRIYQKEFFARGIKLEDLAVDRSHNIFLDIALWSGVAGLMVFVVWMYTLISGLVVRGARWQIVGLAGWLFMASVQPVSAAAWMLLAVYLFVKDTAKDSG